MDYIAFVILKCQGIFLRKSRNVATKIAFELKPIATPYPHPDNLSIPNSIYVAISTSTRSRLKGKKKNVYTFLYTKLNRIHTHSLQFLFTHISILLYRKSCE